MDLESVRNRYLKYFGGKEHIIIPSSGLVPENDPTTLFTGSGMQPILPYLLGESHPKGRRIVNSQKCFRAEDVDEVGDNRHTTFFEMLGNWSLGDYFKKEQLGWVFDFLINNLEFDPQKISVTVFGGDPEYGLPKDEESAHLWQELFKSVGIEAKIVDIGTIENGAVVGTQGGKIFYYGSKKNWWSRAGEPKNMPVGEPGGPDSEIFYEFKHIAHDPKFGQNCHPNCDCGRFMEVGNSVFMQYQKTENNGFDMLKQKNVDFGGGLERITSALMDCSDIFKIDAYKSIIDLIEKYSGKKYDGDDEFVRKDFRKIADHLKASIFICGAGIVPSNKDRGYVVRNLIRRALLSARRMGITSPDFLGEFLSKISDYYGNFYSEISENSENILAILVSETQKFNDTLKRGMDIFEKLSKRQSKTVTAEDIFNLHQSQGLPSELGIELARERGISIREEDVKAFSSRHRDASRLASDSKFKGGLADTSDMSVKYHTATHLLNEALRIVLGDHIYQKGSNITPERLRFDFPNPAKLTSEEIKKVEDIVNEKIKEKLAVSVVTMPLDEAKKNGAKGVFGEKYPDIVTVYRIGESDKGYFSQEICGGPHIKNTEELGNFKIIKEEAISQGVRRIKAILS